MNRRPDFDVIVAGAGVGGAAAAYYLSTGGLRVLVVERARLPRHKACGGAIPRSTLDRLPFDLNGVIESAPGSVRFIHPGQPSVDIALSDQPVVMVKRDKFDSFLLSQSRAEVLERTKVTAVSDDHDSVRVEAGGQTLTARYLVGADGAMSAVAKSLGLRRTRLLGGSLEAEVPLNGTGRLREEYGQRALFALAAIPWGYAWVFPRGDSLSVGIARFRPGRVNLHAALQQQMSRLGIELDGVDLIGHPVPCYRAPAWPFWGGQPQEQLSTRRCVLVGDAAGLVDPLIGEGIRYAITSARLAAQGILNDDLTGYEALIWQEIGHSLATAGLVAQTYHIAPRLCFQIGIRNPAVTARITDVLAERSGYQGIGRQILASTTSWLLRGPVTKNSDF